MRAHSRNLLLHMGIVLAAAAAALGVAVVCAISTIPPNLGGPATAPHTASELQAAFRRLDMAGAPPSVRGQIAALVGDKQRLARIAGGRGDGSFGYRVLTTVVPNGTAPPQIQLSEFQFGWPLPTMIAWSVYHSPSSGPPLYVCVGGSMTELPPPQAPRVIPHRVLWTNLLITVAVIWAVIALPVMLFRSMRRRYRQRRDLCLACGYPTNGADRCPECGAVAQSATAG